MGMQVSYEEGMQMMHVIDGGRVVNGVESFQVCVCVCDVCVCIQECI
jgi:hypothetical protein